MAFYILNIQYYMLNIPFYIISDKYQLPNTLFRIRIFVVLSMFSICHFSIFRTRRENRFYAECTHFQGVSWNMELFGEYS